MELKHNALPENTYFCRKCGKEECGHIYYEENACGHADIASIFDDGSVDYDNFETDDSDNFRITGAYCNHCSAETFSVEELFTMHLREVWELRYGEKYPRIHKSPKRGCKCLTCEEHREENKRKMSTKRFAKMRNMGTTAKKP